MDKKQYHIEQLNGQVSDLLKILDCYAAAEDKDSYDITLWELARTHVHFIGIDVDAHEQYQYVDMRLQDEYETLNDFRKKQQINDMVYDFLKWSDLDIEEIWRNRMFHNIEETFQLLEWMDVADEYSRVITDAENVIKSFPEAFVQYAEKAKASLRRGLEDSHLEDFLTLIAASPEAEAKEIKVTLTTQEIDKIFAQAEGE